MIKVLYYSDQFGPESIMAMGLGRVMASSGEFRFECSADALKDALARVTEPIDILLLDLTADAVLSTLDEIGAIGCDCKLVLWVETIPAGIATQAINRGVSCVVRKSLPTELLMDSLRRVCGGEVWMEQEITKNSRTVGRMPLSAEEGKLMQLVLQGLTEREIAATLRITDDSLRYGLERLFRKLGVRDRSELEEIMLPHLSSGYAWLSTFGERFAFMAADTKPASPRRCLSTLVYA